jgi:hypothetical protein
MDDPTDEKLTKILVDLYDEIFEISGESLWAKPLGDDLYEVRNSPWHNTEINYLDIVKAVAPSEEMKPVFVEVYKRGGHRTIHIYFLKAESEVDRKSVFTYLQKMGITYEKWDGNFYALDLPPQVDFDEVADYLNGFQEKDLLEARFAPQPQPPGTGEAIN